MKKLISLIAFILLLAWTWNLIHSESPVSYETHAIIQERLGEIIQQSVQLHRPEAQDFSLVKLWTETVNPTQIRAHFTYSFRETAEEEAAEQTISGEAFLKKLETEQGRQENWRVEKVTTSTNQVVFEEGTIVGPTPDETPEETTNSTESEAVEQ